MVFDFVIFKFCLVVLWFEIDFVVFVGWGFNFEVILKLIVIVCMLLGEDFVLFVFVFLGLGVGDFCFFVDFVFVLEFFDS